MQVAPHSKADSQNTRCRTDVADIRDAKARISWATVINVLVDTACTMRFTDHRTICIEDSTVIFDGQFVPSDPSLFAVCTVEGDVKCFNLNQSGSDISFEFDLKGHHKGNSVRKIDFTPENWMVTAAKTIKIFDLESKKRIRKLTAGDCKIYSLIVLDNYLLAAGDDNGCFRLYDYRVNENTPRMQLRECEDCISDLDVDVAKRIVLASSGEGTLTAFNVRAKKLDKPQSELFDSGFNCVRVCDTRGKVLVGSDEGVISIFNWKQWGNISDRFPVNKKCSIESIELLDASHILIGNGDGKSKLASVFPNEVVSTVFSHSCPVECVRVNLESEVALSVAGNEIKVANFGNSQSDLESDEEANSEHSSTSEDEGPSKRRKKNKSKKKNKKTKSDFFKDLQ